MTDAGEIIKSGPGEKIADVVNKLAGPMAEEIGLMLGDTVRVYRVKARAEIQRSRKMCGDRILFRTLPNSISGY
jgi:hypothetical protein